MSQASNSLSARAIVATGTLVTAVVGLSSLPSYPGSATAFLAFVAVSVAFALYAVARTPSVFTLALAAFLTLGFLVKALAHLVFGVLLIEPVGAFEGSPASWDGALAFATAGLAGCLLALVVAARCPAHLGDRRPVWTNEALRAIALLLPFALLLAAGGYYLNQLHHLHRIGYPPDLVLPGPLQLTISFLISWGFLLGSLTLASWLVQSGRLASISIVYLCAVLGFFATVTMGSRIQFLLYVFIAACILLQDRPVRARPRSLVAAGLVVLALFVGSLAAVSLERAYQFLTPASQIAAEAQNPVASEAETTPPPAPVAVEEPAGGAVDETTLRPSESGLAVQTSPAAPADVPPVEMPLPAQASLAAPQDLAQEPIVVPAADPSTLSERLAAVWSDGRVRIVVHEIQRLAIMRWVGLEGVMTAAGVEAELGAERFRAGLNEDPAMAMDSLYQQMSGGKYDGVEFFTFLTLPGVIGIGSFSGSLVVIFAFAFACTLAGHLLEIVALRASLNRAASAVCGVSLAYLMVQMPFPWTTFVFAVQLLAASLAIGLFRILLAVATGSGAAARPAPLAARRFEIFGRGA